jgi:2-hydroxychromene-2-carboxylate isomerase
MANDRAAAARRARRPIVAGVSGRAVFFYDFNSPYSWLAAERIESVLPEPPVWTPISYGHVIRHTGVLPWSMKPGREADMREVERRAAERGLGELRWPEGWPRFSTLRALRAAAFALELGKGVVFSLAAFRQQFNAARPLSDTDTILRAGAACELDAEALLEAIEREALKQRVRAATEQAIERGVSRVPTVAVGDELFWGDDRLEAAAAALNRTGTG